MTRRGSWLAWMALGLTTLVARGALADAPRIVKASPDNGAGDVDPATPAIRIEFDQAMEPGGYSIIGGGDSFPTLIGPPRWENDHTLVWRVSLRPEHDYWLSINSDRFQNFRSTSGKPATPYPISFHTGAIREDAPPPEPNSVALEVLREVIDLDYSYRDLRKVDWDSVLLAAGPKLKEAETPREFARIAAEVLAPAKDLHLYLHVDAELFPTYVVPRQDRPLNFNLEGLRNSLASLERKSASVWVGRTKDDVPYLLITSWVRSNQPDLEPAFEAIGEAAEVGKGLIIDVRPNGGGDETLAREFAGCFLEKPVVYAMHEVRTNGKFSAAASREVAPNRARPRYRGPVVVLMGSGCVSSCESFLLMMKQVPRCRLVGANSLGSSGNPRRIDLGNGVLAFVPSWKDLRPDGSCFEGEGIAPDVEVPASQEKLREQDVILEAGIEALSGL